MKLVAAALLTVAIAVLLVREAPGQATAPGATGAAGPLCKRGTNASACADTFCSAIGYATGDDEARSATGAVAGIKFDLARSSPCSVR